MTALTDLTLRTFTARVLRTQLLLNSASTEEWRSGSTPQPREDTTERQKNNVNDPTFSAFADPRRQALRLAADVARAELAEAVDTLTRAADRLERALERHAGTPTGSDAVGALEPLRQA